MQLLITARHMELTEALKDYLRNKIDRLNKYTNEIIEANAILSVEKYRHSAEITLRVNGTIFNSVDITENMYNSIDRVVDKLERQLRKFKEKRKGHKHKRETAAPIDIFTPDTSDTLVKDMRFVKNIKVPLRHMDIKEAIDNLEFAEERCFIFANVKTNQINVIFKNDEGKIILLEPEE